jgi:Glutamine synthetase, catalytic domain
MRAPAYAGLMERTSERFLEAELYRLKACALLGGDEPDTAKAQSYFERALAVARQQQAQLRAAMSLARLWRDQGKVQQARELLAPVYGWFTEGFDTRDLREAKALLEEYGQAEIDMRFTTLTRMADQVLMYKYIIKNVARRHGKTVTVIPKADLSRQRLRHAHAPEPMEGRQERLLRRQELRPHQRYGSLLYRWHIAACSRAVRIRGTAADRTRIFTICRRRKRRRSSRCRIRWTKRCMR